MSKYNILRDDQSENEKRESDDKVKKEKEIVPGDEEMFESPQSQPSGEVKQTPDDDYFSEELFPVSPDTEREEVFEENLDTKAPAQTLDEFDDIDNASLTESIDDSPMIYNETAESEYPLTEKKIEKQPLFDFAEDDKQEGLNYKPIFIGGAIVVAVIAIYLVVSNVFLGDSEVEAPEQKIESAQEKLVREQEQRKITFLSEVNGNTRQNLKNIHQLADLSQAKVKYSSILLYGNSLNLEVFVPDRDVLAKYNLKVKDDRNINAYNIERVTQRRGSKGGLLALYNINLNKISSSSVPASPNLTKVTPETWSGTIISKSGMSVNSTRSISSRQENLFQVNRVEYDLRGSIENSLSLINQLANSNMNITVHKLTLLPTDQRSMTASSYMLKLIIDFYL